MNEKQGKPDKGIDLDRLLDRASAIEPSAELRERILAAAPRPAAPEPVPPWRRRFAWIEDLPPLGSIWRPATALVSAALLGFVLGGALMAPGIDAEDDQALMVEEMAMLAFGPGTDTEVRQ